VEQLCLVRTLERMRAETVERRGSLSPHTDALRRVLVRASPTDEARGRALGAVVALQQELAHADVRMRRVRRRIDALVQTTVRAHRARTGRVVQRV
jgi:hypothetical protein